MTTGLRERKRDRTRTQLLEAALELIGRKGFEETTIQEIAAAVDVSPRTFLRYFPAKEDVIVSWVEDGMVIFMASLEARPADEAAPLSLFAAARAMLAAYQERSAFYLTIERTIEASSAIGARKLELSAAFADQVAAFLRRRAKYDDPSSFAPAVYSAVTFAILRTAIRRWVAEDGQRPLLVLFDETQALVRFEPI